MKDNAKLKFTIKKLIGAKISATKNVKIYVVADEAVKKNGKTTYVKIARTITAHVVGKDNMSYSNAKEIKLTKTTYTLKVGDKADIKAKIVLQYPSRKQLGDEHANEFRYATTDKNIATVDAKGRIVAKKVGTCYVYVYARNGLAKKIKVKVKNS